MLNLILIDVESFKKKQIRFKYLYNYFNSFSLENFELEKIFYNQAKLNLGNYYLRITNRILLLDLQSGKELHDN